ncbi:hypothetical protein WJX81_008603 [Elliptochloris bilobata]|uniref:Uncharacterized protein n=1 Tax=Elliptochloris bilobata TaxID=381761 RepID=A0AAW1S0N9_9CHLO
MTSKREREGEDGVTQALQELESVVDRDNDALKVQALEKVEALVDSADESYSTQKALVDEGLVDHLARLLAPGSAVAVRAAAARTIASVAAVSSSGAARLQRGNSLGFGETPDRVTFNPAQAPLADREVLSALVELQLGGVGDAAEAAGAALQALTYYNRPARVAYLRDLVQALLDGKNEALELLDTAVLSLDLKDDAAIVLDQALMPLLKLVESGTAKEKAAAVCFLGTIVEARPAVAEFMRNEGGLKPVAALVAGGGRAVADAAVHTLWLLVRDAKASLRPGGPLGVPGTALVDALLDLVQQGQQEEEAVASGKTADTEVDNDDDAILLLKALASQDPVVREAVKGSEVATANCCVM